MGKKRVLLGMSGGIDSTVTAILLREMGYEIVGASLQLFHNEKPLQQPEFNSIKKITESLGIKHVVKNIQQQFKRKIIHTFIQDYLQGKTPSICTQCNPTMKFPALMELADIYDCEYIATGHYVRIMEEKGSFWIYRGKDRVKDQSYFLWRLPQDVLKKWITPLGDFTKDETRRMATKYGLSNVSNKKESMGVCFLQRKNYRNFLREHAPKEIARIGEGEVINETGTIVGKHQGFPFYTIGQKQGLSLKTEGKPAVLNVNPHSNTLTVGPEEKLYSNTFQLQNYNLRVPVNALTKQDIRVWVRGIGRNPQLPPKVVTIKEHLIHVTLNDSAWAMAAGQPVVFYEGEKVVGGGIVK